MEHKLNQNYQRKLVIDCLCCIKYKLYQNIIHEIISILLSSVNINFSYHYRLSGILFQKFTNIIKVFAKYADK